MAQRQTAVQQVKPLADRLLVRRLEEEEVVKGGIIIPDTAKEKPQQADIIAVGPGKRSDSGDLIKPEVKSGQRILLGKYLRHRGGDRRRGVCDIARGRRAGYSGIKTH